MTQVTNWVSTAIGLVVAVLVITYASIAKNYYNNAGAAGQSNIQALKSYSFDNSLVDAGLWIGVGYIVIVIGLGAYSFYEKRKGASAPTSLSAGGHRKWY
jgi:preprotein translocase subunit SecG